MSEETENESSLTEGVNRLSRRKMMKVAGVGAAAAWTVPTILTLGASPAAASGNLYYLPANASSGLFAVNNLNIGAFAAGVTIAVVAVAADSQTITAPAGFALIGTTGGPVDPAAAGSTAGSPPGNGNNQLSYAIFVRYDPPNTVSPPSVTWNFSWGSPAQAAITLFQFFNATQLESLSITPMTNTTSSAATAISFGAGSGPTARGTGFFSAYASTSSSTFTAPVLSQLASGQATYCGTKQSFAAFPTLPPTGGTFGPLNGTSSPARNMVVGLFSVY